MRRFALDERPIDEQTRLIVARSFMAGALAALTSKAPRDQLLAECVQFGRAIGTAAEQARD